MGNALASDSTAAPSPPETMATTTTTTKVSEKRSRDSDDSCEQEATRERSKRQRTELDLDDLDLLEISEPMLKHIVQFTHRRDLEAFLKKTPDRHAATAVNGDFVFHFDMLDGDTSGIHSRAIKTYIEAGMMSAAQSAAVVHVNLTKFSRAFPHLDNSATGYRTAECLKLLWKHCRVVTLYITYGSSSDEVSFLNRLCELLEPVPQNTSCSIELAVKGTVDVPGVLRFMNLVECDTAIFEKLDTMHVPALADAFARKPVSKNMAEYRDKPPEFFRSFDHFVAHELINVKGSMSWTNQDAALELAEQLDKLRTEHETLDKEKTKDAIVASGSIFIKRVVFKRYKSPTPEELAHIAQHGHFTTKDGVHWPRVQRDNGVLEVDYTLWAMD